MGASLVHVYALCVEHPVSMEACENRGMALWLCMPCCDFDGEGECTHYLAVVACPERVKSEQLFDSLALYGIYSTKWLTYYRKER